MTVRSVAPDILEIEVPCEGDIPVRALLLQGRETNLLLDTLNRPSDLDEIREVVAGKPLLIVNSHADWDHWWGNAAFPGAPVIAHRLAVERQRREGKRSLAGKRRSEPERFADVVLRPATIAFEGTLRLDLGGLSVELSLLPGHTIDNTVAWIPERDMLFTADAAEDPIPFVHTEPIEPWAQALDAWAERARVVVPAHGAVSGPELLHRNAAYLRSLLTDSPAAPDPLPDSYRETHRDNVKAARAQQRPPESVL